MSKDPIYLSHHDNELFVKKGVDGPWWGHIWSLSAEITTSSFLKTGCTLSDDAETQRIWAWLSKGMSDYKLMLYSVEWQDLRIQMKGDWATLEGAKANGRLIMGYIDSGNTINISRVWRCLNLLNAVRMGFNGAAGLVGTPQDQIVTKIRNLCSTRFDILKKKHHIAEIPSPEIIRAQWQCLPDQVRTEILNDLFARTERGTRETRPELWWFLDQIHGIEVSDAEDQTRQPAAS